MGEVINFNGDKETVTKQIKEVCFWCEKETGCVHDVPFSKDFKGSIPESATFSYDLCNDCKEKINNGIFVFGFVKEPLNENQPPLQNGVYPTGNFFVCGEDFIRSIFENDEEKANQVIKSGCIAMPDDYVNEIIQKIYMTEDNCPNEEE